MPIDKALLERLRQNDPSLTRLFLISERLKAEDVHLLLQALASNSTLIQLSLMNNMIGEEGGKALAENKTLTQLNLWANRLNDESAEALAENKTLTQLDLGFNLIGSRGAKALAENQTLTQLDLGMNWIGNDGVKALAGNKTLTRLGLGGNKIGDEGAKALAENKTLTRLDLEANKIGNEGAKALAKNKTLTQLDLVDNQIGDEGAKALAENKSLSELDLRKNQIGDEGARALAENKTLTQLNLRNNQIGDDGAEAFLGNFLLTNLNIANNKLSHSLQQKLNAHIKANEVRAKQKVQGENKPAQASPLAEGLLESKPFLEKPTVEEVEKLPLDSLSLSVNGKEEKAAKSVDAASPQLGFFKPLVDEEQVEKVRAYALAASLQNAITEYLPVAVTITRGKHLEIEEQEDEMLDDYSREALRSTLGTLFGHSLVEVSANRYRIGWSSLSEDHSKQFVSVYEAELDSLLEASATKTLSEAETINTASFVDTLDGNPNNKVKIAAALQILVGEKLVIEVGMKQGVSMSFRGLSEVSAQEQTKAQALRETFKILTEGNSAKFSEDSIILPWESLRARHVRDFNFTFQTQLIRLESASRRFKP